MRRRFYNSIANMIIAILAKFLGEKKARKVFSLVIWPAIVLILVVVVILSSKRR